MADEEITVTLEPEVSGEDQAKVETVVTDDKPDPVRELKSQYEDMERKADTERQAREDAERRTAEAVRDAARAREEAAAATTRATDSEYETVASGLDAAQAEATSAEQEYKVAFEAGDAGAMSTAQRKMARAEAKIMRFDEAKADIEARKTETPKRKDETRTETRADDPVEAYIANRTEPTKKWLRAHKDYITDAKKNAKLTAAHYNALGEGIATDSVEYFDSVEKFIGLTKTDDKPRAQNGTYKPKRPPAAPVNGSGGGTNGGGTEVRLSANEAKAAQDGTHVWNYDDPSGQKRFKKGDVIGVQEFARRKLEMQRQGLYDKSYTES